MNSIVLTFSILSIFYSGINAQKSDLLLPEPKFNEKNSLYTALKERKSSRDFDTAMISMQHLSNLLWAGCGINRAEENKRTAPSAMNRQDIDIYVSIKKGLYKYNSTNHTLEFIHNKDIRAYAGNQPFVKNAPVNLIFVSDLSKMDDIKDENHKTNMAMANTGFISQNLYLYCASEDLATVIRGWIDKKELSEQMGLNNKQFITLGQTVGYPAK